ncbi:MAG TPA: DUF92 domain-containing protein [Ktedonobacterales bacterium]
MKLKRFLFGLLFSSAIGLVAERRGSLTRSGAAGAVITGTTIFGFGGLSWGLTLIYFFVSSTLLSHFKEREKERVAGDKFSKGARRDIWQALANGGVGTLAAFGYGLNSRSPGPPPLLAAFVGAMATANADTWATEIGTLSSEPPRLITTGEPTAPGTSGGVTLLGTGAAVAGAATVGAVAEALGAARETPLRGRLPLLGLIGGLTGALTDSVLGATVQAIYWCPRCQKETEQRVHRCGEETRLLRGFRWLDNDVVNFASTAAGALTALLGARKLARRA